MGANINPLKASGGSVSVEVTASAPFRATLAVRAADKSVRYIDLTNGKGSVDLRNGEETSLVVANTPDTLYLYDPFSPTRVTENSFKALFFPDRGTIVDFHTRGP